MNPSSNGVIISPERVTSPPFCPAPKYTSLEITDPAPEIPNETSGVPAVRSRPPTSHIPSSTCKGAVFKVHLSPGTPRHPPETACIKNQSAKPIFWRRDTAALPSRVATRARVIIPHIINQYVDPTLALYGASTHKDLKSTGSYYLDDFLLQVRIQRCSDWRW